MAIQTLPELHSDVDPLALGQKYQAEREKRLRADGIDQYIEAKGPLSHFKEDVHANPKVKREPVREITNVVIIGAGYRGLLAAVRLAQQGITDIRIVEKGNGYGGTWYWNQYPGA
jgi:hypothetical protein